MSTRSRIMTERATAAYWTLRGQPPKPDYGALVILPFFSALGGALTSMAVESLVDRRRRAAQPAGTTAGQVRTRRLRLPDLITQRRLRPRSEATIPTGPGEAEPSAKPAGLQPAEAEQERARAEATENSMRASG